MRRFLASVCVLPILFLAQLSAVQAAAWDEGAGDDWKALLAKARQEGGVVLGGCGDLDMAGTVVKAFKADTGITVTLVPGPNRDVDNRYRAEVETGRATIDVRMTGASDIDLAKAGKLKPLNDIFVLPNVKDPANWVGGRISWVDNTEKYLAVPSMYVSTRPVINADLIDPKKVRLLTDLMKPEYKGKIAAFDPTISGSGQSAASYFAHVLGIDFVKKLYKEQQVAISTDQRQLAEWAARGIYPILLGIDPAVVSRFRQQGVTSLMVITPEDAPGSLNGGCSATEIPANPAHPAAAAVFVNWLFSVNGQKAYMAASLNPSLRVDVPLVNVPDYLVPDPKAKYLNQYQEDWYLKERPVIRDGLKDILVN